MRKTNFNFLSKRKQLVYEQLARSYREQVPNKSNIWVPFTKKLVDSKIALVSLTGAYLKDQKPFTEDQEEDDYSYREIPIVFSKEDLSFQCVGWESSEVNEDFNIVLPVERLILLQKEGLIGKIDDDFYSFSGYNGDRETLSKSVKTLSRKLLNSETDGVLLIPASATCSETASLIASMIEGKGIATVVLSLFYEQSVVLRPPRTAFINFPFGRTLGQANRIALQTAILRDTLRLFEKVKSPGEIIPLNFIWSHGTIPDW